MEDKKYVIVWTSSDGIIWYLTVGESQFDPCGGLGLNAWQRSFVTAKIFTLTEARKMHNMIVQWQKTNIPSVCTDGMKIHEYIPAVSAKLGNEVKSERDEIIGKLRNWRNCLPITAINFDLLEDTIKFIEKNTK